MPRRAQIPVYIEAAPTRAFAYALEWPGWCRAGKTEELALDALAAYAERYAAIAHRADLALPETIRFTVVQRLPGNRTTEFGAPDAVLPDDDGPVPAAELDRLLALMWAGWGALDAAAARAPAVLRKGPRGGGRDRDKMLVHVLAAEQAYARKIGVKHTQPAPEDTAGIRSLREAIVMGCREAATGAATTPWPVRYFIRRLTWHALDHLWEMEDRSSAV